MKKKELIFRFLSFTDTHHTMLNPTHRLDNLFLTTIQKVEEIAQVAKDLKVDAVFHEGDLYHSPIISDTVATIIGQLYKKFDNLFILPGNHDLKGNNINTLNQTKLGLMTGLGIGKIVNYGDIYKFEKNGITVQLTGSPSDFDINNDKEKFILRQKECDIAIHLVHAMLLQQDAKFGKYMPIREIQEETVADITISGDFHLGFDPIEYNGKVFLNSGAIARRTILMDEINRMPQYAIINIYDDKSFDYEYIPLKCAKKGIEVLDRSKMEEKKEYQKEIENFKDIIKSLNKNNFNNISDIIDDISNEKNIDPEIIKYSLEKIDYVRTNFNLEEV